MATLNELIKKALAIVQQPEELTMEQFLQTLKALPEPEGPLDASLRLLIVDMAVAEYLGECQCEVIK